MSHFTAGSRRVSCYTILCSAARRCTSEYTV